MKNKKQKKSGWDWNYRIIKITDTKLKGLPQTYSYGIYEVYYKNNKPIAWSKDPMHPIGETFMGLWESHHLMQQAFLSKVLELKNNKLIVKK